MELEERIKYLETFLAENRIKIFMSNDVEKYKHDYIFMQDIVFYRNSEKLMTRTLDYHSIEEKEKANENIIKYLCESKLDDLLISLLRAAMLRNEKTKENIYDTIINPDTSIRERTLDEAKKCILGDREQDYGSPEDNFATIAKFWSSYLDKDISAQQVADMMILMKISRIKNGGGTGDSYVDIAGYAACGNEILGSKTRK